MKDQLKQLQGINIYLIGMMGSGKTTVGQRLAQELHYRFFDTDAVIERAAGETIADLFASAGESAFRDVETSVLAELSAYRRLVIATGGGIVLKQQNWSYLQHGLVIWLNVPIEELYRRLQGDQTRPLLQGVRPLEKLEELLSQRQPLYAQADLCITVQAEEPAAQVVDRILETIPTVLKHEPSAN